MFISVRASLNAIVSIVSATKMRRRNLSLYFVYGEEKEFVDTIFGVSNYA